jgi:hypothetical protein
MIGIMIGVFIIGLMSGFWINIMLYRSAMRHSPNELIECIKAYHDDYWNSDNDDEDIDDPNSIIVSIERVNTQWFLYDVTTKMFAGQGKSLDEAVAAVKARFPNKDVVVQQVLESV